MEILFYDLQKYSFFYFRQNTTTHTKLALQNFYLTAKDLVIKGCFMSTNSYFCERSKK